MKKLLLLALVLVGGWLCLRPEPRARWTGRPETVVRQSAEALPPAWERDGCTFRPLAKFAVRAVVLSRERYIFDDGAKLAPVDLALGWGPLSEARTINALRISQDHRWYEYRWADEPPLDPALIARSSANMHLIPANGAVRAELLRVRRHELVEFSGYLVEVHGPTGWTWRSSTSRDDTGGGACELVWVERIVRWSL